jgi:hypothetical protein
MRARRRSKTQKAKPFQGFYPSTLRIHVASLAHLGFRQTCFRSTWCSAMSVYDYGYNYGTSRVRVSSHFYDDETTA